MAELMPISGRVTMTGREIATLVELRHDKVKQSIERLAERGAITLPTLVEVPNDGPGPDAHHCGRQPASECSFNFPGA
nr:hypothetical protein [uncultured Roseateles sp.]